MPTPYGAGMLFTLSVCCFYRMLLGRVAGMSFRVVVNAPLVAALHPV